MRISSSDGTFEIAWSILLTSHVKAVINQFKIVYIEAKHRKRKEKKIDPVINIVTEKDSAVYVVGHYGYQQLKVIQPYLQQYTNELCF